MVEVAIAKFEIGKRGKTESKAEVGKALPNRGKRRAAFGVGWLKIGKPAGRGKYGTAIFGGWFVEMHLVRRKEWRLLHKKAGFVGDVGKPCF